MTDQGPQATLLESGLTENTVLVKEPPLPAKLESQKSLEADAEPSAESSVIKQETENTHHVVTAFEPATPLATVDKSLMTSDDIPLSSKLATLKEAKKDVAASSSPGARLKDIAASSTDSDNAPLSNKVKTPQFKFSGPPRLQNVASESTDSDLPLSAIAASSKSRKPPVKLQDLSPDVVESDIFRFNEDTNCTVKVNHRAKT
ncbi:hypothetical protein BC829DRAFT_418672 [Chytridium lagenaria]|nr:hypothetical protein BC829DRAFT_418672 [Chytridium lagenaria]